MEENENQNLIRPELERKREATIENTLRPQLLNEYIGQDKVKENMKIYIEAAKKEESLLITFFYMDHQA